MKASVTPRKSNFKKSVQTVKPPVEEGKRPLMSAWDEGEEQFPPGKEKPSNRSSKVKLNRYDVTEKSEKEKELVDNNPTGHSRHVKFSETSKASLYTGFKSSQSSSSIVGLDSQQGFARNSIKEGSEADAKPADDVETPNQVDLFATNNIARRFNRSKTRNELIDYFGDDESDALKRKKIENNFFYYDSEINFSKMQYIEVFFHHGLYFMLFGPFVNVLRLFSKRIANLYENMKFGVSLNRFSIIQLLLWISTMLTYYCFFIAPSDNPTVDAISIVQVLISFILRITSIAGKYATFPKVQYEKYNSEIISFQEFAAELMLAGWKDLKPEVRLIEIQNAFERLELDKAVFYMSFFEELSEGKKHLLRDIQKEQTNPDEAAEIISGCGKLTLWNARYIYELLLLEAKKVTTRQFRPKMMFLLALGVIWAAYPVYSRAFLGLSVVGTAPLEIITNIYGVLVAIALFMIQATFYNQAIDDLANKHYLMNQLGFMISPQKIKTYKHAKFFPTINILDPLTLYSWVQMRRLVIDVGKKYFYRHEVFLPVMLFLSVSELIGSGVLYYLQVKTRAFDDDPAFIITRLIVFLMANSVIFGLMSVHFLFSSGAINSEFSEHLHILKKNKTLLQDLLKNKFFYFRDFLKSDGSKMCHMSGMLTRESESFLHIKLRGTIRDAIGKDVPDFEQKLGPHIEEISEAYSIVMQNLEDERHFDSIKILEHPISKYMALELLVTTVSVSVGLYQLFFGQN